MAESILAEELLEALCPGLAEDILLALRMAYYCRGRPLVPDAHYDQAEREYLERPDTDAFTSKLNEPGSDRPQDYPPRVHALSLYLGLVEKERNAGL